MKNDRNCSLEKPILERSKQVTGLLFHMRITVNGKEQRFNGVRLILFNEIGVGQVNFWISLCDPNAFITHSMLMSVWEDTDLFLSNWTTDNLDITKPCVYTLRCCFCLENLEIRQNGVLVGESGSHITTNWYSLTRRTPCKLLRFRVRCDRVYATDLWYA